MSKSEMKNCNIYLRHGEDETLFEEAGNSGHMIVRLDGYTIIPNEDFLRMENRIKSQGIRLAEISLNEGLYVK